MKKPIDPVMHTAEHILNQAMGRLFQTDRCFSAHIEKKKSKCDYRFHRPLSEEDIRVLEAEVNRVIQADLAVSEEFCSLSEAGKRYNLGKLPTDAGDSIRIVKIGDYDACPCIGPHVASTREIGGFRITTSSFEEPVLRIRFKVDRHKP
jgi:Ser-tRNA(Ala) deacylase AlaX